MAEPAAAFEDRIENGDKKMGEMPVESCSDVGVTDMELRRVPGAIPVRQRISRFDSQSRVTDECG
jgi:hypothetical protein